MIHQIVFFIEQIANGVYLLLAIGVLANLRSLMQARRELVNAEFELERELASRRQAGAITRALAALEVILAIYAIAHVVAPTLRSDVAPPPGQTISEPGVFVTVPPAQATLVDAQGTPLAAENVDSSFQTLTARPPEGAVVAAIASPTVSPTPPGTIIPGAPAPVGCDRPKDRAPDAILDVPANGQVLFEAITVRGIANAANFSRYKFEISGPSTGNAFTPFGGDKTSPVKDSGVLGQVSLLAFEKGTYLFKLAVFDSKDQLKASCTVTVYLQVHPATATPSITPTPKSGS
jgi:hypothetical protein